METGRLTRTAVCRTFNSIPEWGRDPSTGEASVGYPNVNCFTVRAGAPVTDSRFGVPLEEGIWFSVEHQKISLGTGCYLWPDLSEVGWQEERLFRARLLKGNRFVRADSAFRYIYVKIVCRDLRFQVDPLADDLNLWAGGDGAIRPVRQYGSHKDSYNKRQLFELSEGQSIVLVDTRGATVLLGCFGGKPTLASLTAADLAEGLFGRANASRKHETVDWALHNLEAINKNLPAGDMIRVAQIVNRLKRHRATL